MKYQNHILCVTAALLTVVPAYGFNFVVVNNTQEEYGIKIRLKGPGNQPEYNLGLLKAGGGTVEKKFIESQAKLCVDYIKVGDISPEIFEVSADQYAGIISSMGNPRDVTAYFQNNRAHFKPVSPVLGACENRRFDIVGNVNNQLIIITKSIY